jgi:hypothetical protein
MDNRFALEDFDAPERVFRSHQEQGRQNLVRISILDPLKMVRRVYENESYSVIYINQIEVVN